MLKDVMGKLNPPLFVSRDLDSCTHVFIRTEEIATTKALFYFLGNQIKLQNSVAFRVPNVS